MRRKNAGRKSTRFSPNSAPLSTKKFKLGPHVLTDDTNSDYTMPPVLELRNDDSADFTALRI